ncbi:MBOAT family protein [Candidatus Uabimicrobium sp. HlEnr_7]|uniref:MBOAT family O-acyltransferase n=1 Tax=Candidatus Uabimicrobium helgolandensis TaxID=3095367 RepID=UPI003559060D
MRYKWQNIFLVAASYFFYGYIHPAFCLLLFISTISDYFLAQAIVNHSQHKKYFLVGSLCINIGVLFYFKYFGFFAENVFAIFDSWGWEINETAWKVVLPVGISFYTFQTLSYTIDVYREKLQPTSNFIYFALYVCFFPQLVAGPIERATRLLPQISQRRYFDTKKIRIAFALIVWGFCKKLVIADNVGVYVNQIFLLEAPSLFMLLVGALGFSIQILADFSAYTDIARGCAFLLGFELMENFKKPYLAISPSDFWKRWHISLSSWIRDYLYIPLGGSKGTTKIKLFWVILISMTLSGLWHGAAWTFILWGVYHGVLVFVYHLFGIKGSWKPKGLKWLVAWVLMYLFTLFGWLLFRTHSVVWLFESLMNPLFVNQEQFISAITILLCMLMYSLPYAFYFLLLRFVKASSLWYPFFLGSALCLIFIFGNENGQDFIYFRF